MYQGDRDDLWQDEQNMYEPDAGRYEADENVPGPSGFG
jgi:hypothetical protein